MAITNPSWMQNAGAINSAQMMRLADSGAAKGSALLTGLAGRGGIVRRGTGLNMQLLQVGGGNMTVNVEPGICYVPGTEHLLQAGYWVVNDATLTTAAFGTAHASLNRIDTVYVKVNDSVFSGGSNNAQVLIQPGTAGSGVAGSLSGINNAFKLGEVTVRAGSSQILTADINNNGRYFSSPGGITAVRSDEGNDAGTHSYEFSVFNNVLRFWQSSANQWQNFGINKVSATASIPNPQSDDLCWFTPTKMIMRYTGSAWEDWIPSVPGATLRNTSGATIGSGSYVAVAMDWEDRDTLNGHSTVTNTSRYTAQRQGRYRVWGGWSSPNTTQNPPQSRGCALAKNGTLIEGTSQVHTGVSTNAHVSIACRQRTFSMNVGDYVELMAFQNSGSSLTSQTSPENQALLEVEYIGI